MDQYKIPADLYPVTVSLDCATGAPILVLSQAMEDEGTLDMIYVEAGSIPALKAAIEAVEKELNSQ